MAFKTLTPDAVRHIVVHCSASPNNPSLGVKDIDRWHRERGFAKVGYHFVIQTNGTVQEGRKLSEIGAHAVGHNSSSLGICLIGGTDNEKKSVDNFTSAQKTALYELLAVLRKTYTTAIILGHRDLPGVKKDCPCWAVIPWAAERGL